MKKIDGIIVADEDDRIEVKSPTEIPDFSSDEEEMEFWRTHTLEEGFWREAPPVSDEHLPRSVRRR